MRFRFNENFSTVNIAPFIRDLHQFASFQDRITTNAYELFKFSLRKWKVPTLIHIVDALLSRQALLLAGSYFQLRA